MVFLFGSAVYGDPWPGSGDANDPYQIHNAQQMQAIGADPNYWGGHFKLMKDIDLSDYTGTSFNIIGNDVNAFTGVFDGDGHTISNLTYDSNGLNYIGLFGYIDDPNAEIKNLGLIEPDVNTADSGAVGCLIGRMDDGTVKNCYVEGGSVSGDSSVGGLAGESRSSISGCYSTCSVTGEFRVGGLAGANLGSVSNSYSMGTVIGDERVGGLVGEHYRGSITSSYSAGSVTGVIDTGGLVGFDADNIAFSDSLWDVNSSGQTTSAGGTGRSTEQMQSLNTFVEYGWGGCGNGGEWTIDDGNDYPRLAWEGKAGTVISGELIDLLGGTGTPGEPYLIYNASQLNMVGAYSCEWSACFKLMSDIDLSAYTGTSFNIIGYRLDYYDKRPFTGVFDGNGHTISNFTYEISDIEEIFCIGLFGLIDDPNAEVKNLGLIDPNIHISTEHGSWDIGSLAGHLDKGTIRDCYVEGGFVRGGSCGGLVGSGSSYCDISNCHFEGTVTGTGHVGGLMGGGSSWGISISNCYSAGSVTGEDGVGGLVGSFYPAVYISISDCYSTSNVTGTYSVGGLIGENERVDISNSYATGSVTGYGGVGGLVGGNGGIIANSYSAGSVSGTSNVGGLVGNGNPDDVTDSYWDVNSSGQIDSDGGEGKTTEQMQDAVTFTAWLCDESEAWTIDDGNDYPRLWWENKPGGLLKDVLYGGGNGTESEPYLIYTAKQLNTIGLVECNWDKHFKLMADIDLSEFTGDSFNIIGVLDYDEHGIPYTGIFDGDGHTISNFTYDSNTTFVPKGLFGAVGSAGCVKNLGLRDVSVHGTYYTVGGLVGSLSGTIMNCYVEGGSVTGEYIVGGLVGFSKGGNIFQCYSTCEVTGDNSVGGLAGYSEDNSIISSCYSKGNVTGSGAIGGLLGANREGSIISNCYSAGRVVGDDDVGGLVGYHYNFYGDYTASFWDSDVNPDVNGIGNADEPNVEGLPTVLMQTASTFTDAGWDFVGEVINGPNDIWDICEGTNYPKLVWSIPAGDFMCPDGVNMFDFAVLGDAWFSDPNMGNWDPACDISEPNDNVIDGLDLAVFVGNWLEGQ